MAFRPKIEAPSFLFFFPRHSKLPSLKSPCVAVLLISRRPLYLLPTPPDEPVFALRSSSSSSRGNFHLMISTPSRLIAKSHTHASHRVYGRVTKKDISIKGAADVAFLSAGQLALIKSPKKDRPFKRLAPDYYGRLYILSRLLDIFICFSTLRG